MKKSMISVGLLSLVLAGCGAAQVLPDNIPVDPKDQRAPIAIFDPDNRVETAAELRVEVAQTPEQRVNGLIGRDTIGSDGMLFSYPNDKLLAFQMTGVKFPLDILYFDGNGNWVSGGTMEICEASLKKMGEMEEMDDADVDTEEANDTEEAAPETTDEDSDAEESEDTDEEDVEAAVEQCPAYISAGPARFALQVPAGFIREKGISAGWRLALGMQK